MEDENNVCEAEESKLLTNGEAFSKAVAVIDLAVEKLMAGYREPTLQFAVDLKEIGPFCEVMGEPHLRLLSSHLEAQMGESQELLQKEVSNAFA